LEKVNFLSEVDVLNKKFKNVFEKDQLDSLAQLLKQEYFREGSTILRQGEVGDTFYIIQSGEVSIHIKGQSEPIATLGKGKFFGEMALLSEKEKHSKRAATVKAIR
jgi:CRP-like cAMP-binding protein